MSTGGTSAVRKHRIAQNRAHVRLSDRFIIIKIAQTASGRGSIYPGRSLCRSVLSTGIAHTDSQGVRQSGDGSPFSFALKSYFLNCETSRSRSEVFSHEPAPRRVFA